MGDDPWPLSAPATQMLLALPEAGAKPRRLREHTEPVKVALKELLLRGAVTMEVEHRRFGRDRVTLAAGRDPGPLPPSLDRLLTAVRPQLPGEIQAVLKSARALNPHLVLKVGSGACAELVDRGLIEELPFKRLGLFSSKGWVRTTSGEAWARAGAGHLDRLRGLGRELESDPDGGMQAAAAAGPMLVMVPAAMGPVAREDRRRRDEGSAPFVYGGGGGGGVGGDVGSDFDLFQGLDGLLGSGMDAIDGGLDAAAGAIDGAIDSGIDAGGFGGDGGGGGGDGGGGGGN